MIRFLEGLPALGSPRMSPDELTWFVVAMVVLALLGSVSKGRSGDGPRVECTNCGGTYASEPSVCIHCDESTFEPIEPNDE